MDYRDERNGERVWLRVGPTLKADMEEEARADNRDLSEWARLQLQRLMESKRRRREDRGAGDA